MTREDRASRLFSRGVCGVATASGKPCGNVRNECPYHPPEEQRCQSCKDEEPATRCKLRRDPDSLYCNLHSPFPNLGLNLQRYAEAKRKEGAVVDKEGFCAAHYPKSKSWPPVDFDRLVEILAPLQALPPFSQ